MKTTPFRMVFIIRDYMAKDFKTIGEVSCCTGIEKRRLKYYIEQGLMKPSQKDPNNDRYWLYNDEDIEVVQRIALYDELGYKSQEIKAILNNPTFEWQNELDRLIPKLQAKRKRIDCLIFAAECMRWVNRTDQGRNDFDISSFDGNIEKSIQNIFKFSSKEKKEVRQALRQGAELAEGEGQEYPPIRLLTIVNEKPASQIVQDEIDKWCKLYANNQDDFSPEHLLFAVRMLVNLYGNGFDFLIGLYTKQKSFCQFLIDTIQIYCDNWLKNKTEV